MKAKENIKSLNTTPQADALTDLPVAEGQAEEAKGGVALGQTPIKTYYCPSDPTSHS